MHKIFGCAGGLLLAATLIFHGQAMAADKFGVVDMRKVLSTSAVGQKAHDAIERKGRALQADLKKDEDALIALQNEAEKKNAAWSEAVKKEKAAEFQKKMRDFSAKREKSASEMNKMRDDQLKPLHAKVMEAAKKVAKAKNYDFVLPREALIVVPDSSDISDLVVSEVNKMK
ncbi:MAG: OmpH family outer membrane protein [Desulfobulbus sp.]|jgi:outer membrane protein|nr:OmpH family outer membrane protein [Desulfobulbus sp.]